MTNHAQLVVVRQLGLGISELFHFKLLLSGIEYFFTPFCLPYDDFFFRKLSVPCVVKLFNALLFIL